MAKRKSTAQAASAARRDAPSTAAPAAAAAPPTPSAPAGRRDKAELRATAARKRQRQTLLIALAGGAILLLLAVFIVVNLRGRQPAAGEETFASQGNLHIALGSVSPVAYNSMPPTSGPHYENLAAWGNQPQPIRYEHLVHNLEDGGVVVYYQCPDGCPEVITELETVLEPYFAQGRNVVLTVNDPTWTLGGSQPLHQDMGAPIMLTAWRKRLPLQTADAETIRAFVDRYEGIDHHRG